MTRATLARVLAALALLPVLLATLTPGSGAEFERAPRLLCFACGPLGGADLVRNVLLFAPWGFALALAGWPLRRILLVSLLLAAGIELAQTQVPGRHPALGDALANGLGSALGAGLLAGFTWAATPAAGRWAGRLCPVAALAAGGLLVLPGPLSAPALPETTYFVDWIRNMATPLRGYEGRVLASRLGDLQLAPHEVEGSREVRELLLAGAPLEIRGVAGRPPPGRLAGIFEIHDIRHGEMLLLGSVGDDLVVRLRNRAVEARLVPLAWRAPGALAHAPPGEALSVRVERRGRTVCVRCNDYVACPVGFRVGDGWSVLFESFRVSPGVQELLGAIWVAALVLPVGHLARRWVPSVLALALLGAALEFAPPRMGLLPTPPTQLLGAVFGFGAGLGLRRVLSRGERT